MKNEEEKIETKKKEKGDNKGRKGNTKSREDRKQRRKKTKLREKRLRREMRDSAAYYCPFLSFLFFYILIFFLAIGSHS